MCFRLDDMILKISFLGLHRCADGMFQENFMMNDLKAGITMWIYVSPITIMNPKQTLN